MTSAVVKRSVIIHGHKTSVSIEDEFWLALKELAAASGTSLSDVIGVIEADRVQGSNLSSAIRVHVLSRFIDQAQALAGTVGVAHVVSQGRTAPSAATAALSDSEPERGR